MSETKSRAVCKGCGGQLEVDETQNQVKCPYCGTVHSVAEILGESDAVQIEKMRTKAQQQSEEKWMQMQAANAEKEEKKQALQQFKKSKFAKVLLVFAGISLLAAVVGFSMSSILSGIIGVVQAGLFLVAWLMGMQIIPEKKHNIRVVPAIVAFVLIIPFFALMNTNAEESDKPEDLAWADLLLGDRLPEVVDAKGKIYTNTTEELDVSLDNISARDYLDYVSSCQELAYTVDAKSDAWSYSAYDVDGYQLDLDYSEDDKELRIDLNCPIRMTEIDWPDSEIGRKLPKPDSTQGKIELEYDDHFDLMLGGMTEAQYKSYIQACKEKGFTVDYVNSEDSYTAYNADGDRVEITYKGNSIVEIEARLANDSADLWDEETPDDYDEPTTKVTTTKEATTKEATTKEATTKAPTKNTGIRPEFKKSMDSYEKFMDEYIAFMKKYSSSTDAFSMLADYTRFMTQYATMVSDFEAWEDEDLSDAELALYTEVQLRVSTKLLSVSM